MFDLGTMYWINPNDSISTLEEDMHQIKENNFTIIRSFIWWEWVERKEGIFDYSIYDRLYDAADKYGLKIMETFGVYLPVWLTKRLLAQGIDDRNIRYSCFDRPEVSHLLETFMRNTVTHFKDAPALKIWNIWNEPTVNPCRCKSTLEKFMVWLQKRYSTIHELRQVWLAEHQLFPTLCPDTWDDLTIEFLADAFEFGGNGRNTAMRYDWLTFTTENTAATLQRWNDLVKSIDPKHEVHSNPATASLNGVVIGLDEWRAARALDSIGTSVHPTHHLYGLTSTDNFPAATSFCFDMLRSWAQGRKAYLSESQAGTTIHSILRDRAYSPTPEDIAHTLYFSWGKGLCGALFWQWQSHHASTRETTEYSLRRSFDGGPTLRSKAAWKFGQFINAYDALFSEWEPQSSKVAIFTSMSTKMFHVLQQNTFSLFTDHTNAAWGCYQALNRANICVDFVTEMQILEGQLDKYKVVFMPHVEVIGKECAIKLRSFVDKGGVLWADGRCGFLDEHIFVREMIPGNGLSDIFGANESDFVALRSNPSAIQLNNGKRELSPYLHLQYLTPTTGEVIGWHEDRPCVVRNRFGRGTAELCGTYVCLNIQQNHDLLAMNYLAEFALANGAETYANCEGDFEIVTRRGRNISAQVVYNRLNKTQTLALPLSVKAAAVECPQDVNNETTFDGFQIRRMFQPHETVVFLVRE